MISIGGLSAFRTYLDFGLPVDGQRNFGSSQGHRPEQSVDGPSERLEHGPFLLVRGKQVETMIRAAGSCHKGQSFMAETGRRLVGRK